MIATADEAVEALRHKRTGEVLPTKKIARNTRLVYYADELVGLQLHATVIALYKPNGVSIDVRGPGEPNGWFTNVTWSRIDQFTPARTSTQNGLRFFAAPGGWESAGLYAHGTHVNPDGSCEIPLDPALQARISKIVRTYPARLRKYADRLLDHWRQWGQVLDCCENCEDADAHLLSHFEAGEVSLPRWIPTLLEARREPPDPLYGNSLLALTKRDVISALKPLTTKAVKRISPDFPYPQATRTRT